MDKALNREILRLSLPSILANLTVPLVGLVDTAIAGHLPGGEAAALIGGISVGSMLLSLLYWNFIFLRTGTGGLTAQAFGREEPHTCALIFTRGIALALLFAIVLLAIQVPFSGLASLMVNASPRVCEIALRYFFIRIWAAPATLCLMVFRGWFVGMQDSMSSMWTDLVVNTVNIAASLVLSFGAFGWSGIGFDGIATGTVVAQYSGLLFATLVCLFKYGGKVFGTIGMQDVRDMFRWSALKPFLKMNGNLMGRSLCFMVIYLGYTMIAAGFGEMLLACSSIMMQLLMFFSYFTDGFAYAGEALSGRFIGARDAVMFHRTVKYVFIWSMGIALLSVFLYWWLGVPSMRLLTSDEDVVAVCSRFLPWLLVMPPLGCAAFTWDGIYLGATDSGSLFVSMLGAMAGFLVIWFAFKGMCAPGSDSCMHVLLGAYFAHLAFRTLWLSLAYGKKVKHLAG